MTRPHGLLPSLLLILTGVAVGCSGTSHRLILDMEVNNTAKVMITGYDPQVLVENMGPGKVQATFLGRTTEETTTLDQVAITRTLHEPTQVVLRTDSSGPATVLLEADRVTNFIIDQIPSPTPPGAGAGH